jgi:hypothetical protein
LDKVRKERLVTTTRILRIIEDGGKVCFITSHENTEGRTDI